MTRELEHQLALCRNLPSLPAVAVQIISLAQDPEADLAEVARTISLDPALSTKLLRIANSPLYATKRRVDNLRQALTVLGLNATLSLALGFSLSKSMRQPWGERFDFQSVVRRSILAATAARCLGEWAGLARSEDLLLAGLIQDIGILALGQVEPEKYATVLADAADNARLVALERERLGTDHAQIGAYLGAQWGLPEFLIEAIRQSESEQPEGEFNLCVALSGPIADIWIQQDPDAVRDAAADLCSRHLGMDRTNFAELTAEISAAIPEISSLFDMSLADPQRIESILDHARELMVIRNLKGLQEATRERHEAERLNLDTRALRATAEKPAQHLLERAAFDAQLASEFDRMSATGGTVTVMVLAHDSSDPGAADQPDSSQKRAELAQMLAGNVRETDVAAVHGSHSICVLLPRTSDRAATSLCWRILQAAAASGHGEDRAVSIGVATLDAAHHYPTAAALLDAAEYALQCARDAGGNRIERAGF